MDLETERKNSVQGIELNPLQDNDTGIGHVASQKGDTQGDLDVNADLPTEFVSRFDDLVLDHYKRADPEDLCPFCDEKLPPEPSNRLQSLIQQTKKKVQARRCPRPWNRNHVELAVGPIPPTICL